jgi:hypothetical protein
MFYIIYRPVIISTIFIVDVTGATTIMDVWGFEVVTVEAIDIFFNFSDSYKQDNDDCQSV